MDQRARNAVHATVNRSRHRRDGSIMIEGKLTTGGEERVFIFF